MRIIQGWKVTVISCTGVCNRTASSRSDYTHGVAPHLRLCLGRQRGYSTVRAHGVLQCKGEGSVDPSARLLCVSKYIYRFTSGAFCGLLFNGVW